MSPRPRAGPTSPNATFETLEGQNHMVKPKALAPTLAEFFGAARRDAVTAAR